MMIILSEEGGDINIMYNRNIKEAIKHMELLQEQLESLEQRNDKLIKQLNAAICLLCSNKAKVVSNKDTDVYWNPPVVEVVTYQLQVQELDGNQHGEFSPESTPYQAVLTGIQEYIEYMTDKQP